VPSHPAIAIELSDERAHSIQVIRRPRIRRGPSLGVAGVICAPFVVSVSWLLPQVFSPQVTQRHSGGHPRLPARFGTSDLTTSFLEHSAPPTHQVSSPVDRAPSVPASESINPSPSTHQDTHRLDCPYFGIGLLTRTSRKFAQVRHSNRVGLELKGGRAFVLRARKTFSAAWVLSSFT